MLKCVKTQQNNSHTRKIKKGPPLAIFIEGAVHVWHNDSYAMMTFKIGIANVNLDPFCRVFYDILPSNLLIRDSWLQCFDCDVAACVLRLFLVVLCVNL